MVRFRALLVGCFCLFGIVACTTKTPSCSDESTIGLVKKILYEQLLEGEARAAVSQEKFNQVVRLDFPAPTRSDEKIGLFECSAKLVVNTSAGVSGPFEEKVRALIMAGVLSGALDQVLQGVNKEKREFTIELAYSSQLVDGRQLVRTGGMSRKDAVLLNAFAGSHGVPQQAAPSAPTAAPSPTQAPAAPMQPLPAVCTNDKSGAYSDAAKCDKWLGQQLTVANERVVQLNSEWVARSGPGSESLASDSHSKYLRQLNEECPISRVTDESERLTSSARDLACRVEFVNARIAALQEALSKLPVKAAQPTPAAPSPDQLAAELKDQDTRLNAVYQAAIAKVEGDKRTALRMEQRAWIRDRDARCGTAPDTSMPGKYERCAITETKKRADELGRM